MQVVSRRRSVAEPPAPIALPIAAPLLSSLDVKLREHLDALDSEGLRRSLRRVDRRSGAIIHIGESSYVDFASNDYLGLASDPRIAEAATAALQIDSTGSTAARSICGNHAVHEELERSIALYKGTEAALLFTSGYAANLGAIPALIKKGDAVYTDRLNHASLIDGCRLSRAEVRIFPHRDLATLKRMLAKDTGFRRKMIVVDSVFSMDGDLFPLDDLVEVAQENGAWTYVDDAHATGVLGEKGTGSVEHFGVEGKIDVVMGTLGKALGIAGAFIAGSNTLIQFLINRARSFVFTTASPPAMAAATIEAIRIAREDAWRREKLRENGERLRRALGNLLPDASFGSSAYPHILPVIVGSSKQVVQVGAELQSRGFIVGVVRPPSVATGTSRLRITSSALHTDDQIDTLAHHLTQILRDTRVA
jgi:8-amino-7-oxononanoate synthase